MLSDYFSFNNCFDVFLLDFVSVKVFRAAAGLAQAQPWS